MRLRSGWWGGLLVLVAVAGACTAFDSNEGDQGAAGGADGGDAAMTTPGSTGDGATADGSSDGPRPLGASSAIACGEAHTCVVSDDASVLCWGANDRWQLGNDGGASTIPVRVDGLPPVVGIAAGGAHTCAVDVDAGLWCWGENSSGEIGIGVLGGRLGPKHVNAPDGSAGYAVVDSVSASLSTICVVHDGVVYCAGSNSQGEIGLPPSPAQTRLVEVPDASASSAGSVAMGAIHACATVTGGVVCWGNNQTGECGVTGTLRTYAVAADIADAGQPTAVAAGDGHSCILDDQKHLWCWGYDQCGQAGSGPSQVPAHPVSGTFKKLAAGGYVTCTIDADDKVACMGANDRGQLGVGTMGAGCPNYLVAIPGLRAKAVAVGGAHACALPTDGGVVCWGANDAGQLGTNDLAPRPSPASVAF